MVWFKVDDGFYDHPKFLEVPNAAIGLWVKAGAWCARHLTDGVIPAAQVTILKGTKSQIDALIMSGVWVQTESQMGGKAYRFHDWNDHQPTRSETLKAREDASERKRKSREQKAPKQQEQENVTRDTSVTGTRDSHVRHKGVSHDPDPTRPDPTLKDKDIDQTSGSTHTAERFDEFWSLVPRKVGKDKARPAYTKAVKRAGDEQVVIDGMRRLSQDPNLPDPKGPEARFIAHPTTWLNEGRWNDDPLPPRSKPPEQQTSWGSDPRHWLPQEAPQPTGPDYASGHVVIDDDRPF